MTLSEIWNSDNADRLRKIGIGDYAKCQKCDKHNFCDMCAVYNYNENGDLFDICPRFCEMAEILRECVIENITNCIKSMDFDKTSIDERLLDSLSQSLGVSGFEQEVCSWYIENVTDSVDKCFFDVMGNAYGIISGSGNGKNIMVEAHADEIGFQILYIGENGYLYLRRNGGVDEQCIPGSQVIILTCNGERINGVIGKNQSI